MPYTVRTSSGEHTFASIQEIQKAVRQGRVGLDDEVRQDGVEGWQPLADVVPAPLGRGWSLNPWFVLLAVYLALGIFKAPIKYWVIATFVYFFWTYVLRPGGRRR